MPEAVGAAIFDAIVATGTEAAVEATFTFMASYGSYVLLASTMAYSASEARRMQAQAKDAAANAARDRTVTVNGAIVPRDLVMGRARTGGANIYHAVTGPDSSVLYILTVLAAHEIDAVEQIYVNDLPVTLNSQGYVIDAPYLQPSTTVLTATADSSGNATLQGDVVLSSVTASMVTSIATGRQSDRDVAMQQSVTVSGSGTIASPYVAHTTPGALVSYQTYVDLTVSGGVLSLDLSNVGALRFAVHLGGAGQTVDPWLHAEFPTEWLSTYVVEGCAYMVAQLKYDTNSFPSGVPQVSALVRGAKLRDPRNGGSTYTNYLPWSEDFSRGSTDHAGVTRTTYTGTDPLGNTSLIHRVTIPASGAPWRILGLASGSAQTSQNLCASIWIKQVSGGSGVGLSVQSSTLGANDGGAYLAGLLTVTSSWARYSVSGTVSGTLAGNFAFCVGNDTRIAALTGQSAITIDIFGAQLEIGTSTLGQYVATTGSAKTQWIADGGGGYPEFAWSENPALMMRHVYGHPWLGNATPSADEDARFIAAANACDLPTVYTIDGVPQASRALYTAGGVWRFDGSAPSNILNDLAQAMGGAWAFAGGELYMRAGVYTAPVLTLTDADLATVQRNGASETQAPIQISVHRPTADMVNTVKPVIYDAANDYKQMDLKEVTSSTLVARDGATLSQPVQMLAVNYAPQAKHIAGIILRDGRDPLTVKAPFKMKAYPLELLVDAISLQLTELGIDGTFLVVGYSFVAGVVNLTLKETAAQITTVDADFSPEGYASNSNLPKPWDIPAIGTITVQSGDAYLLRAGDGTVRPAMRVTWPTVTTAAVLQGGTIEVDYRLATATKWSTQVVPGDSTQALIGGITDGNHYLVRARLCSSVYKGAYSLMVSHTVAGKTTPPPPFDSFGIRMQPDGTRQFNFAYGANPTPPDWLGAEIRYLPGSFSAPVWDNMVPLQDGTSYYTHSPIEINAPQGGLYTFACKSLDASGNESTYLLQTVLLTRRRLGTPHAFFDEQAEGWTGTKSSCSALLSSGGLVLEAVDSTTWATAPATWSAWTRWNMAPASTIVYTGPVRDLGSVLTALLDADLLLDGDYVQEIKTSVDNTTWSGWGSTSDAFTARYIQWRITVSATTAAPVPAVQKASYTIY